MDMGVGIKLEGDALNGGIRLEGKAPNIGIKSKAEAVKCGTRPKVEASYISNHSINVSNVGTKPWRQSSYYFYSIVPPLLASIYPDLFSIRLLRAINQIHI